MDHIDQARDIRPGEEFDSGAVEVFLKDSIPDLTISQRAFQSYVYDYMR
jgi:hypothetical protein